MIIQDHDSFIEIVFQETVPNSPVNSDLSFTIMANCDSFVGSDNGIWIERAGFNNFLEDLRNLATFKKGVAELKSISPYKFILRIYAKTPDDFRAEGELCKKIRKGEDDLLSSRIVFGIRIDSNKFSNIVHDFNVLLPKHRT